MFILYTVAPLLYRMASSAYYNLSLLSSDFFGLLFGLFLFQYRPYWLYFPAFAVVLLGLVVYFWSATRTCCPSIDHPGANECSGGAGRARSTAAGICAEDEVVKGRGGADVVHEVGLDRARAGLPSTLLRHVCLKKVARTTMLVRSKMKKIGNRRLIACSATKWQGVGG
jgi:hypothetical protein